MKRKNMKKLFIIPVLAMLTAGIFSSCDIQTPSLELAVSTDFITHLAQVNLVADVSNEAAGGLVEQFDGAKSKITITGTDADRVYNLLGKKEFSITGGALVLLLEPSANFSSKSSYTVNVLIEATGFLSRNVPVVFTKEQNNVSVQVALVDKSSLPSGASIAESSGTALSESTGLAKEVKLTASNASTNGVTTKVTVPAGIKMKDSNGKLLSGRLKAEVVSFSGGGHAGLYFPGGLAQDIVVLEDGSEAPGMFLPAAFTSINMSVGSEKVRKFDGGTVGIKMTLSKINFNPETGQAYEEGDKLDIWSYEEANGQWKFESRGIVKTDADGSHYIDVEASHLSVYAASSYGPACDGRQITFDWPTADLGVNTYISVGFSDDNGSSYTWYSGSYEVKDKSKYYLEEVFSDLDVTVRIYDLDNNVGLFVKTYKAGDICDVTKIAIKSPYIVKPRVSITTEIKCAGAIIFPPQGTIFYYTESGAEDWKLLYKALDSKTSKIISDKLEVGKIYDFKVFIGDNDQLMTNYIIESANISLNVELPKNFCDDL
jgi:hypothetical protein